jgi:hypothetical protein
MTDAVDGGRGAKTGSVQTIISDVYHRPEIKQNWFVLQNTDTYYLYCCLKVFVHVLGETTHLRRGREGRAASAAMRHGRLRCDEHRHGIVGINKSRSKDQTRPKQKDDMLKYLNTH